MKLYPTSALILALLSTASCSDDKDDPIVTPSVVKEWTVPLSAANENPAPAGRTEAGTAELQLLSDNSLKYTLTVTGLKADDQLSTAHLHTGDVITSGPVVLPLDPTFTGGNATGTVNGLRSSLVDSLKSASNEIYVNIHSTQVGSGLVRGQLNTNVEMASEVALSGANEVPAVNTTAAGMATLRLTSDKKLYSKITVEGLEANDTLTAAHIHPGGVGSNGGVLQGIYGSAAEFGTTRIIDVPDSIITKLKTDSLYVNAHSKRHPAGIIRGQIR
ncbi:MAG TPA: CHRD domain-containing protein [Flavitalea sp.]|nr:CHRD domain-containing protein [Flavitalea sp.]